LPSGAGWRRKGQIVGGLKEGGRGKTNDEIARIESATQRESMHLTRCVAVLLPSRPGGPAPGPAITAFACSARCGPTSKEGMPVAALVWAAEGLGAASALTTGRFAFPICAPAKRGPEPDLAPPDRPAFETFRPRADPAGPWCQPAASR